MTDTRSRLKGLYVITDPALMADDLLQKTKVAIQAGACIVQYRNKQASTQQKLTEARKLREVCQQHNAIFIVNDDPHLALAVDADGVHIGQSDSALESARRILGKNKIIGVSCNNRFEYAEQAIAQGADYIAFGRFYPSMTKPDAPQATTGLLRQAQQNWSSLPVVAIGGITPENGRPLVECGATMLAVIHGIFAQPDVQAATQEYVRLFSS